MGALSDDKANQQGSRHNKTLLVPTRKICGRQGIVGCLTSTIINVGALGFPPRQHNLLPPILLAPERVVFCRSPSSKMLYLVGLGLSDETDITVKGLEIVKKASRVYLEAYTSILLVDQTVLVSFPIRWAHNALIFERPSRTNTDPAVGIILWPARDSRGPRDG